MTTNIVKYDNSLPELFSSLDVNISFNGNIVNFQEATIQDIQKMVTEERPTQLQFYKNQISNALKKCVGECRISSDNFIENNYNNYKELEEEILRMAGISSKNYSIFYTGSGTDSIDKIGDIVINDYEHTLIIKSKQEHPSIIKLDEKAKYIITLDLTEIIKYHEEWVIESTDWFNNIKQSIINNNINKVVLSIIGTHNDTGDIVPNLFINKLQTEIKKITFEKDIDYVSIIDATQELFITNRDYSKFDFIYGSGHILLGPNYMGFVFYKKTEKNIKSIKNIGYTSEKYMDNGHNPYMYPILKTFVSNLSDILKKYPEYIYYCSQNMEQFSNILEKQYNIILERVSYNKLFNQIPTIFTFTIKGIDLNKYKNKYDSLNFIRDINGIIAFRVIMYYILMDEQKYKNILLLICKIIQDNHNKYDIKQLINMD